MNRAFIFWSNSGHATEIRGGMPFQRSTGVTNRGLRRNLDISNFGNKNDTSTFDEFGL